MHLGETRIHQAMHKGAMKMQWWRSELHVGMGPILSTYTCAH